MEHPGLVALLMKALCCGVRCMLLGAGAGGTTPAAVAAPLSMLLWPCAAAVNKLPALMIPLPTLELLPLLLEPSAVAEALPAAEKAADGAVAREEKRPPGGTGIAIKGPPATTPAPPTPTPAVAAIGLPTVAAAVVRAPLEPSLESLLT